MFNLIARNKRIASLVMLAAIVYMVTLLVGFYNSQEQLRVSANAELQENNAQTAALIHDFLGEQRSFVGGLSETAEVQNYLTNVSLGMSIRYGLGQNLFDLSALFRQTLSKKKVFDEAIYERIVFLDVNGQPLVDTGSGPLPPALLTPVKSAQQVLDSASEKIYETSPVLFHGEYAGSIVAISPLSLLQRYLRTSHLKVGLEQLLITDRGVIIAETGNMYAKGAVAAGFVDLPANQIQSIDQLPQGGIKSDTLGRAVVLRSTIAGADLSLVTVVEESILYGRMATQAFFVLTVLGPLFLFVFFLAALWAAYRNKKLQADIDASNQRQSLLQDKNDALNAEIDKRIAIEEDLRASESRYRTYIDHAPEGIFVFDATGVLVDANLSFSTMLGYGSADLKGQRVSDFLKDSEYALKVTGWTGAHVEQRHEIQSQLIAQSGASVAADLRFVQLPNNRMMCFCVDITEKQKAEAQIHNLAYFDPLTGLPNRRLLIDRIEQTLIRSRREKKRCAVLMIDLDNFKNLNDSMGHDVGDLLLCAVGRRLIESVRNNDTVSRLGGDEFVVLVEGLELDVEDAANHLKLISAKIHQSLSLPYNLMEGKADYRCGCSIGISLAADHESTVELLMKQSDVALYAAKNSGRNAVKLFSQHMQAAIDQRALIEGSLRKALDLDQLQLYCQGQVNADRELSGAELLLRWMPDANSSIPPAQFIPLAEETGLITNIGNWILDQACAKLERWSRYEKTALMTLSVNVSSRQFHDPEFVERLLLLLEKYPFPPNRLMIELTESIVLDNVDQVAKKMRTLKDRGIRFSLDDFGTGYSSLSYLKSLPIDEIKIDQSFVRDITVDHNDAAIVCAIVAMSQSLGFEVIAEGVENEAQRDFLLKYGCTRFQGFLFSKPTAFNAFLNH